MNSRNDGRAIDVSPLNLPAPFRVDHWDPRLPAGGGSVGLPPLRCWVDLRQGILEMPRKAPAGSVAGLRGVGAGDRPSGGSGGLLAVFGCEGFWGAK